MAEKEKEKNKFQQRTDAQAEAAAKAYAELREVYDDPTDEQITAALGDNLRGYQRSIGKGNANFGSTLFGTLNQGTRDALESQYQKNKKSNENSLSKKREESVFTLGEGDGAKTVTKGLQMDVRNWGDTVDENNITPEQAKALNTMLASKGFSGATIPTIDVTTKDENGNDVVSKVEQSMTLNQLLDSMSDDELDALQYLGFVDDEGAYIRPHNESWEEKLARKERERERIDMLAQQQAIERQRARLGLAELGAGIGDIIKASTGAYVDKRNYDNMYAQLTAQQQKNFDGYLTSIQAQKERARLKAKEAEERAYQERLIKTKYEREDALLKAAQEREDAQRQQDHDWRMEEIRARGANSLAVAREKSKQKIDKFNNSREINYGGVNYTFADNAKNEVVYSILGVIKPYFTESNGYHSMLSGIEDSRLSEYDRNTNATIAVLSALESLDSYFTDEDKARIKKILLDYSKGRATASTSSSAAATSAAASAHAAKKYKAPNGTIITQEQYNGLSQAQKDKCVEVTE